MLSSFKDAVSKFLSKENIVTVKDTGNPKSLTLVSKFKELVFRERKSEADTSDSTIQNSWFNRPFNSKNRTILIDKVRYALQIIAGIADLHTLPVSYIYDLGDRVFGVDISPRLYLKDRGNIMHILSNLNNLSLSRAEWMKVITQLEKRPSNIVDSMIDSIKKVINRGTHDDSYTIDEIMTDEHRHLLAELDIAVKITIESLAVHKDEMRYINNNQNPWTPNTFGMLALTEKVVRDSGSNLDLDAIARHCGRKSVFLGDDILFGSRKGIIAKYPEHEAEPLYRWLGCREYTKNRDIKSRYISFEKEKDIDIREESYVMLAGRKTKDFLRNADTIQEISNCTKWAVLKDTITTTSARLAEEDEDRTRSNIDDLDPSKERAAMRWVDMIVDIHADSASDVSISHVTTRVVSEAIEWLTLMVNEDISDNKIVHTLWMKRADRNTREVNFYTPLQEKLTKEFENEKVSEKSLRKAKLTKLEAVLSEGGLTNRQFIVVDREGDTAYSYSEVSVRTGQGFHLGHKVSRMNGGRMNADNTFLQFENDNIYNTSNNITEGYWSTYLSWLISIEKSEKRLTDAQKEHFKTTKMFCEIMVNHGQLI